MNVLLHSEQPYESSTDNPLGPDRAPHRIWTWGDGSWVLVRFLDDGPIAISSPDLVAHLSDHPLEDHVLLRVARASASHGRGSTL